MDMTISHSGYMNCAPGHSFGPATRDCCLFHLILSGCGVFEADGRTHVLHARQGFLILPGQRTRYQADMHTPWSYAWIGLRGVDAVQLIHDLGLGPERLIWSMGEDERLEELCRRMQRDAACTVDRATLRRIMAGDMLSFLNCAATSRSSASGSAASYCDDATLYIRAHLNAELSVEKVAEQIGLSRSQLFRIFRQVYGVAPRAMIQRIRAEQARYMLLHTPFSLEQIAEACGYANVSHFCVAFRRDCGLSPASFRKTCHSLEMDE